MRIPTMVLSTLGLVAVSGCDPQMMQRLTDFGVSPQTQQLCVSAAAQQLPTITEDMDFSVVMDDLRADGMACLIASVRDVLTARVVSTTPDQAGDVIAADPVAEAAI